MGSVIWGTGAFRIILRKNVHRLSRYSQDK